MRLTKSDAGTAYLVVASVLWDANAKSEEFSRCYTDEWAAKLFRGFDRNLTLPHRNVLFTDRKRDLPKSVEQIVQPDLGINSYGDCVRPFQLNEAMIFVGLDTIITGNIDKLGRWCLEGRGKKLALPKHPFEEWSINGVVLVAAGQRHIFDTWTGQNDMDHMRSFDHDRIDDLWPGKVVSFRGHVRGQPASLNKARIVYFHGRAKPHEVPHEPFVRQHWV